MVSAGMQHYLSYSLGRVACNDEWATRVVPVNQALQEAYAFGHGTQEVSVGRAWGHFGLGALMVGGAMLGRMTFVWWPFHPVGVMLANTWPLHVLWFSIAVGWGIKTVMLKYGGAGAFGRARPVFHGVDRGGNFGGGRVDGGGCGDAGDGEVWIVAGVRILRSAAS